ncbi:N-acetyltransferase [Blastococcus sp. TML/M2B]|uniref:GNAT family N-acetyltransferase n=1 Tax=unclassified Blastococcus TaxID=2619396 RepID=UPI00190A3485|nr:MULTISPECIES: GNAT family N-acetyltransferase [unclassified Blastococcus]MBN1091231.1 N-acetyltransferase [Blastococcus sp. TML/M2B]MBN1095213.1 N-acetyltransferase [Blastococcus sp. TML/C7B]
MDATTAPRIRPATAEDLAAVAAVYAHHVEHGVATFDLEAPGTAWWAAKLADLDSAGWPFLVAEDDGELLGFAYLAPWRIKPAYRQTVEDTIYLAPGRTGRGTGRVLLGELLARGRVAGVRQVIAVITDSGDPASLELHGRFGFVEAGRLRAVGFKHGRWLDTLLVQADLTGPAPA